jgi:hypothetical protein
MPLETISEDDQMVIRRSVLEPGEATHWHIDPCRRFSVVVRGEKLAIEYRDGEREEIVTWPGEAGWNEPEPRLHRAVNTGATTFEEVVTFYLPRRGADPQPEGFTPGG